jgi:multiple sugar transport system permease protein
MINERTLPYWLIAPSVLFLLVFFAYPFAEAFLLAFRSGGSWTFGHFHTIANDIDFTYAVRNTLLLTLVVVPVQVCMALGMAMMLTRVRQGRDALLYVWTVPLGISDLAAGIIWLSLLTERGYINSILMALGVIDSPQPWLSYEHPGVLFLGVVLAEIWRATAILLVIIVAGVQLIPKEYGEAAEIFGAGPWQRFFRVTVPLLKPSLQTALILRTILALEVFATVAVIGGINMPVMLGEAFEWQFTLRDSGAASAYAVLILGLSILATVFYLIVLRTREEVRA